MRWFLVLLLFLSSGVFADITCADRKGGTTGSFKGRDGYSGKEACNKDNNCIIKLELSGCYGGSGSGNDGAYEWCSYYGTYTGAVCNASVPPLPQPPTENYCDSASTIDTKKSLQSECEAQGGEFVYSCDRDKGVIDWKCNPKKKPDSGDGSGDSSGDGVSSDTKTPWRNCGKDDLYCLAFMHASIDNVSRLIKQQTESTHNDFSNFQNGFDVFNQKFDETSLTFDKINNSVNRVDSDILKIDTSLRMLKTEYQAKSESDALFQESLLNETKGFNSKMNFLPDQLDSMGLSLMQIENNSDNTADKLKDLNKSFNRFQSSFGQAINDQNNRITDVYNVIRGQNVKSENQGKSLKGLLNGQGEALNKTYGDIDKILNGKDNPLQNKVFDNPFENVFRSPQAQCPEFSITMFGETAIIKDHCRALDVLNKFMVIVMWAWCGIALFNDAKEIYLRVTTNS